MDNSWTDLPASRIDRPDRSFFRRRLVDLLLLTFDMLMICAVSLLICLLCGRSEHVTLSALGIAIYVSCKHFGHLHGEITALRKEVALSAAAPRRRLVPADNIAPEEEQPEWWEDDFAPESRLRAAMTR
jgi:hypothetical protein